MAHRNTSTLISALEQLSSQVERTAEKQPDHLDEILTSAISTTSQLIQEALPVDQQHGWLSKLENLNLTSPKASPSHPSSPCQSSSSSPSQSILQKAGNHGPKRQAKPIESLQYETSPNASTKALQEPQTKRPCSPLSNGDIHTQRVKEKAAISCLCAVQTDNSNSPSHVSCIHGCGWQFCSATCRKRCAHSHSLKCAALVRKKVLKSIGLLPDPDLF